MNKLKVRAIVAVFNTEKEASDFINYTTTTDTFVSFDIKEIDGVFKATLVVCNPYDATKFVLEQKTVEQIRAIAKANKVSLTGEQIVKTSLSKQDVEKKIENGEITDSFIKHNLDALFAKSSANYRKEVFKARGISLTTQKVKKTTLSKARLISRLLMEASEFNYDDYAYEICFLINK